MPNLFGIRASSLISAHQHLQTQPLHSVAAPLPSPGGPHPHPTTAFLCPLSFLLLTMWQGPRVGLPPGPHPPLKETSTFYLGVTMPHVFPPLFFFLTFPSGQGGYFYFISWNLSFEIINHLLAAIFLHPGMQNSHNTLEYFFNTHFELCSCCIVINM